MKFFNVKTAINSLFEVTKRFPLTIVFAFIAAFSAINAIDTSENEQFILRIILSGYLGLVSSIAVHLFIENRERIFKIVYLAGFIFLIIYYYLNLEVYEYHFYRFGFYLFCSLLFLAVSIKIREKDNLTFWNFNKIAILRLLQSFFFSGILNIGLSIAIFAIEELFGGHWDKNIYAQLAVFVFTIFNAFFFLSGIPKIEHAKSEISYPNSLKLLSTYILIPITLLYAIILYLYLGKIIINWSLPNGWVSSLVIYYSVVGLLAYYIIYPIKDKSNKLSTIFTKYFALSLLPVNILMTISIFVRIDTYSFTENRLIVMVFNFWLYLVTFYFIFIKEKNLKLIPISLIIIAFILVTFPINIMTISEKSQLKRFEEILIKEKVIVNGKIDKEKKPDKETIRECQSIISYMNSFHKYDLLKKWIRESKFEIDSINLDSLTEEKVGKIFNLNFEFKFSFFGGKPMKKNNINFDEIENFVIPISEISKYDYNFVYKWYDYQSNKIHYLENQYDNRKFEVTYSHIEDMLKIKYLEKNFEAFISLRELINKLHDKINNEYYKYYPLDYSIDFKSELIDYKIFINSARWDVNDNTKIDFLNLNIYYKINNK